MSEKRHILTCTGFESDPQILFLQKITSDWQRNTLREISEGVKDQPETGAQAPLFTYIYMHIYVYTYLYVYASLYIFVYVYVQCVYNYIFVYACM